MEPKKYRWSKAYESAEEELLELFALEPLNPERIHVDDGSATATLQTTRDTTIWCAEGSLQFEYYGKTISLQPGDALDIPSSLTYQVVAGFMGGAYYQITADHVPIED